MSYHAALKGAARSVTVDCRPADLSACATTGQEIVNFELLCILNNFCPRFQKVSANIYILLPTFEAGSHLYSQLGPENSSRSGIWLPLLFYLFTLAYSFCFDRGAELHIVCKFLLIFFLSRPVLHFPACPASATAVSINF